MEATRAPWAAQGGSPRSSTAEARAAHIPIDPAAAHPVSPPYHTSDVLSPTAAPWATAVPVKKPLGLSAGIGGGGLGPGALPGGVLGKTAAVAMIQVLPHLPQPLSAEAVASQQWQPARKEILSAEDLKAFLESDTAKDFMAFILALNEAVIGKKANDPACHVSPAMENIKQLLSRLSQWVDDIPPAQQSLRYGNPAFRTWFAKMAEHAPTLVKELLPENLQPAAVELATYLIDSFGNATRIDYGTGHETTFCALLYCLSKLGILGPDDRQAAVLVVFKSYLTLMRKIQTTYWLEPAGSHGVWGLDDYQFLPFIWGSAQLVNHPMIKPKSIHNPDILDTYYDDYLYLGAVRFVKQVKKGPLGETSPMINDISTVPAWAKVNQGMLKMYQVEVLSKFPIMQHFLLGSLLAYPPPAPAAVAPSAAAPAPAAAVVAAAPSADASLAGVQ